jgi:hypothetical protein
MSYWVPFREQSPLSGPPQQGGHLAREPATQVEQRSDHCRLTKRGSLTQGVASELLTPAAPDRIALRPCEGAAPIEQKGSN